ncbi:MAG: YdbH domain-containing protein [Marinobacter sp.]|uniref:intermembrane phospholipid transport protein YdbH family protein n=1 Tax=Marinobacter sp. TaxID=50741 RepID=UPI00356AFC94
MVRLITIRRFLFWLLALLLVLLLAGAWYARVAWEEWQQLNSIRNVQWQGMEISLAGVQLEGFTVSQERGGHLYAAEGEELSLGWSWHWHGPMPNVVRVGRLTVDVPAWPGDSEQSETAPESPGSIPRQLPDWLPDNIDIDQLELTLPDGIRATGDLAVSGISAPEERNLVTRSMKIEAPIPSMTHAGWRLGEGRTSLVVAGSADEQSATLDVSGDSYLELARLEVPGELSQIDTLRVSLTGTKLTAAYDLQSMALEKLDFDGSLEATAAAIHQPQLLPQPWRLAGQLHASLQGLSFDGRLSADAGTEADVGLRFSFDGTLEIEAQMTVSGAKGGLQMANTFTVWPRELEIDEGSVRTSVKLRVPSEGIQGRGEVAFDGASGLFARMAWSGLSGRLAVNFSGERLDVRTSGLDLDAVNPGIPVSNIRVAGGYQADTGQLAAGTVTLEQASSAFLGGNVAIESGQWQLSELPVRVPLELDGVRLSELMQIYPAEGLAGTGVLRGTVPVQFDHQGVSIEAGQVEAVSPGGTLKLPAERLRGMAQNNEAMALVVKAMENFNYTVLNSTVDYDQDGRLVLGLRLEGSSPDVRDGHPIVLNINLEEDIPALLTSLQLSGRVNEAVTEKVRDLIQKRDAKGQSGEPGNQ